MSDLVSRLRDAAVFYADYPDLVKLLGQAATDVELCRREVEASRSKRSELRVLCRCGAPARFVNDGVPFCGEAL